MDVGDDQDVPRAVVMVQIRGRWRRAAVIGARQRCDLELVDQLARLALQTGRAGVEIRLVAISDELRELLRLAGLHDLFGPTRRPTRDFARDEFLA